MILLRPSPLNPNPLTVTLTTNHSNRLNYFVGGAVMTLCHLDQEMYMLGYLPKEDRVFLIDKTLNVVSYKVRPPPRTPPPLCVAHVL